MSLCQPHVLTIRLRSFRSFLYIVITVVTVVGFNVITLGEGECKAPPEIAGPHNIHEVLSHALLCAMEVVTIKRRPALVLGEVDEQSDIESEFAWEAAATGLELALPHLAAEALSSTLIVLGALWGFFLLPRKSAKDNTSDRAHLFFNAALTLDARSYETLLGIGILTRSIKILKQAASVGPDRYEAYFGMGHLYELALDLHWQYGKPLKLDEDLAEQEVSECVKLMQYSFRAALDRAPWHRITWSKYGRALRLAGLRTEAQSLYEAAAQDGIFAHPSQHIHAFYFPSLPVIGAVLGEESLANYPELQSISEVVQRSLPHVQQDFHQLWEKKQNGLLLDSKLRQAVQFNQTDDSLSLFASGMWEELTFFHGVTCASQSMPNMCAALAEITCVGIADVDVDQILNAQFVDLHAPPPLNCGKVLRGSVSIVHPPKTSIAAHSFPMQGRLRLLCPLSIPDESESRLLFHGRELVFHGRVGGTPRVDETCHWFDESFMHEQHYRGSEARAVLLLDVVHPALYRPGANAIAVDLQPAPTSRLWWQEYFARVHDQLAERFNLT